MHRRLWERGKGRLPGFSWTRLDSLGFTWIHLDSLGLTWTHLDSLGLTWTQLDSLGLTWIHLVSLELTKTRLNSPDLSLEPHKTRTKYHPEPKREKGKGTGQLNFSQFRPHYQTARTHARTIGSAATLRTSIYQSLNPASWYY